MDRESLADVIRRAQRQEAAAFDVLVDHFGGRIYGFLYRLTGSRDDAEDLTQEVYLRIVRMIGRYRHDDRFEAWVFRIAANLVRDRGRRLGREPRQAPPAEASRSDGERIDRLVAPTEPPDRGLQRSEEIDRLNAALAALPPAEAEVVMLRHFSDLSFKEIADILGTPLGTALARGHRGLLRLRDLMDQHGAPSAAPTPNPEAVP